MFEPHEQPFTHWVDDSFAPVATCQRAAAEFPPPGAGAWQTFTGEHENGKAQSSAPFGPTSTAILGFLTHERFVAGLEELTGIAELEPDVIGGGMHQTGPGGRLDVHVDFNAHPHKPGRRRALNLLLYLNDGWAHGDGGELVLWDGDQDVPGKLIAPIAGRAVLFPTSDTSWHGHPNPVAAGRIRRSIAVYYFAPGEVARRHSTEWLDAR